MNKSESFNIHFISVTQRNVILFLYFLETKLLVATRKLNYEFQMGHSMLEKCQVRVPSIGAILICKPYSAQDRGEGARGALTAQAKHNNSSIIYTQL